MRKTARELIVDRMLRNVPSYYHAREHIRQRYMVEADDIVKYLRRKGFKIVRMQPKPRKVTRRSHR